MSEIEQFVTKYEIGDEGKEEIIKILNKSLIEISKGILETSKGKEDKKIKNSDSQRFKSKKAEEYAEEHGLSMDDFTMLEISKKDVEDKVREITKSKDIKVNTPKNKSLDSSNNGESSGIIKLKREKVICSGINKKGEACKSVGTLQPDGAKKKYCFRHAEDFRSFECDSDSSDEEDKDNSENEELKEEEIN